MRFTPFITAIVSLAFLDSVLSSSPHNSDASLRKRHTARSPTTNISLRAEGALLEKRFSDATLSFYDAGLGACGEYDTDSDFIVALNVEQFTSNNWCFQPITITYNGKTAQATIVDECMKCPYGGLDLSRGLFDYFASESLGIIYGTWELGSGESQTTTTTKAAPTTSKAQPTTTHTTTTSSTTSKKTTTSTTYISSSSSSAAQTTKTSTSVTSTSSAPSTTSAAPAALPTDALGLLGQAMLNLGNIVVIAVSGQ